MDAIVHGRNAAPTCHGGLENLDEEHSYWIDNIEGDLPSNLVGTFFRNGPGRQRIGGKAYGHWFDGDGMISQFTFTGEKAHFANRYVRTPKYVEETEAQEILYRGFGTQIPGGLRKNFLKMPANPANTSSIYHGGKLLALNEGGHPWELIPGSLETIGEGDFDGMLKRGEVFSAHGKVHPRTGNYINFGAGISGFGLTGPKPCINVYRIDQAGKMTAKAQVPLDRFPFCHDFALTDRYGIFFINSILFGGMGSVILGTKSISDNVRFDNDVPMRIVVVDLDDFSIVQELETDPGAIIHFGNAYEDGNSIVIDGMFASDFEANDTLADVFNPDGRFGGGTYNRYRLNVETGALEVEQVTDIESEFPTFNPSVATQKHSVCYTACSVGKRRQQLFQRHPEGQRKRRQHAPDPAGGLLRL